MKARSNPRGRLLEPVMEISGPLGFAYGRSCELYRDFRAHDRLMLVIPRGDCVMEVRVEKRGARPTFRVNRRALLVVPARVTHDDEGVGTVYDTVSLFPSDRLIATAAAGLELTAAELAAFHQGCRKITRTARLDELIGEYFYARVFSGTAPAALEVLILTEVLRRSFRRSRDIVRPAEKTPASAPRPTDVTARALRLIEADLFCAPEVAGVARRTGASVSTLLRKFREDTGKTPYAYIKHRRLEEAMRLLKRGAHPVGEIATLVGYGNFGAFSEAFRSNYGRAPSHYAKGR